MYARPYDPKRPQVCFDEMLIQLIAETRKPLSPKPGQPERLGSPDSVDTQALLSVVRSGYRPFQLVALDTPSLEGARVPFL